MARRTTARLRMPEHDPPARDDRFADYARLLEEAATTASSEAGHPPAWYDREGTAWVIRRTTIDCAAPIAAGAEVEVLTWVVDFRRVRSRRRYEVRSGTSLLLRADTDWVYVDRVLGRPKRIPPEMMEAFVPGGAITEARDAMDVGPAPHAAFVYDFTTAADDVDALGHVNNARYFAFLERTMAARGAGGAALRAIRHDVEYLDEARGGDRLSCKLWVVEAGALEIATQAEIVRQVDAKRLTVASSRWVRA